MSSLRHIFSALLAFAVLCSTASAQNDLTALARVEGAEGVHVLDRGRVTEVRMELSQPVPWRVYTLDDPVNGTGPVCKGNGQQGRGEPA